MLLLLAVPLLLLAGWGLLFGVPTLAVVAFTAAWILLPLFNQIKAVRVLKFGVSFLLVPATLALAPLMVQEVDQKVEQLARKPRNDVSAFTLRDRLGTYGLNIVMGVAGYPLYPEASKETLLMMVDPGPGARRVFYSDFALGSRKVRMSLRDFAARLQRSDSTSLQTYGPVWVEWPRSDYRLTEPEARYALALNQTRLTARAERQGERWSIAVRLEMEVKYPANKYVTLIGRPQLRMEEGLFWVLQSCGWIHPYTAEFRFKIHSDDSRLR
ncbi:hypothetical protein FJY68_07845 [candidate division WOR-3 bacterium]|uniref:Uncharacterized protein n=1 Tax=candidate division WOR-3 bacterium TaxID=2052148 RepID=A0A937XDJ8_UNCW3|nr:hypothetical protein [candidate division WOR-3 bacterium]